jgi:hypothetical protein
MQLLRSLKAPLGRSPVPCLNEPLTLRKQLIPAPGRLDVQGEHLLQRIERARGLYHGSSSITAPRLLCEPLGARRSGRGYINRTPPA